MPEDVIHRIDEPGFSKRTAHHSEIHNIYGMENSRATGQNQKRSFASCKRAACVLQSSLAQRLESSPPTG
jgi:hypothetical protein